MPRAIALRPDFSAIALRCLARRSKDAAQARRLLALAAIDDGDTRSEAARSVSARMRRLSAAVNLRRCGRAVSSGDAAVGAATTLGLPTARAIAEAHGGTLEVANAPGGGVVATLALPRRGGQCRTVASQASRAPSQPAHSLYNTTGCDR